ncbi:MAG: type II secretion system F family protein [Candidatus Sifarchaeia archaeon]|jgi:flagellar protein FlaJ
MSKQLKKIAYLQFGKLVEPYLNRFQNLGTALKRASIEISLRTYLSVAIFSSLVALIAGFLVPFVVLWAFLGQFTVLWLTFWQSYVVAIIFAIASAIITFLGFYAYPFLMASGRKKTLDSILPAAASYMAAMASAGVPPDKIFISLSSSDVELALSEEARTIARDLEIFGYDILKTLQEASKRSPSRKFATFLEGMIATITSGGDLNRYLATETKTLMRDKEVETREYIESLGIFAELYLTAAVVGPLFFVIMFSILGALGGGAVGFGLPPNVLLSLLVYLLIPAFEVFFIILIDSTQPAE